MSPTDTPARPFAPVADSQRTFRVILDALARPGSVGQLPASDPRCPLPEARALATVALTLLDHEVTFALVPGGWAADGAEETLTRFLHAATGSRPAPPAEADYLFACGPLAPATITTPKRGSLAFPDEGATLLVLVPAFAGGAGLPVTLTGAGIPGALRQTLPTFDATQLAARREANAEGPRGIDLLLLDHMGQVLCLPRTTTIAAD